MESIQATDDAFRATMEMLDILDSKESQLQLEKSVAIMEKVGSCYSKDSPLSKGAEEKLPDSSMEKTSNILGQNEYWSTHDSIIATNEICTICGLFGHSIHSCDKCIMCGNVATLFKHAKISFHYLSIKIIQY